MGGPEIRKLADEHFGMQTVEPQKAAKKKRRLWDRLSVNQVLRSLVNPQGPQEQMITICSETLASFQRFLVGSSRRNNDVATLCRIRRNRVSGVELSAYCRSAVTHVSR